MPDSRLDDRAWTDAIDRYAARAGSARSRRRGAQGRWVLASAVVLAVAVSPFAVAATGSAILEGKRNPTSGASSKETQLISKSKTYGTRQSNVRNGNGGGAIYGCRSKSGREPCIRSNNLSTGRAFEFETDGGEAGRILSKSTSARPFSTNATGVASGLNADRVDNFDVARIDFKASPGTAQTDVLNMGGLILRASCGNGPDLALVATTTVPDSTLHIGWNKDPGNLSFYRQENDLDPGETFTVITNPNDDSVEGTISYSTPAGAQVSITFQSEEGNAFGNTVPCFLGGTALGG